MRRIRRTPNRIAFFDRLLERLSATPGVRRGRHGPDAADARRLRAVVRRAGPAAGEARRGTVRQPSRREPRLLPDARHPAQARPAARNTDIEKPDRRAHRRRVRPQALRRTRTRSAGASRSATATTALRDRRHRRRRPPRRPRRDARRRRCTCRSSRTSSARCGCSCGATAIRRTLGERGAAGGAATSIPRCRRSR